MRYIKCQCNNSDDGQNDVAATTSEMAQQLETVDDCDILNVSVPNSGDGQNNGLEEGDDCDMYIEC